MNISGIGIVQQHSYTAFSVLFDYHYDKAVSKDLIVQIILLCF